MPEPTKIPRPFADSGDKNSIPDSSGGLGFASWQEGFPAITGTPFAQGGVAPKRADFNGIFNALSLATLWQQQGGFYEYDATTDYEVANVVEYNGDLYKCITANGPSSAVKAPTDTTVWSKVMTAADAAALYLPLAGGTMTGAITATIAAFIKRDINTQYLQLCGGTSATDGALLSLNGKGATAPGAFTLRASDGNVSKSLVGYADGTLNWDSKPLLLADFASGHLKINNRVELEVAYITAAVGINSVTFDTPFTNTPRVFTQAWENDATTITNVYSLSTTGFSLRTNTAGGVMYLAVSLT